MGILEASRDKEAGQEASRVAPKKLYWGDRNSRGHLRRVNSMGRSGIAGSGGRSWGAGSGGRS